MKNIYTGTVVKGEGVAARLGFPTINIPCSDETVSGIYAAVVTVDGNTYHAALFVNTKRVILEAHLLDFSGDLYGKEATMELRQKIRESQNFKTTEALSWAMKRDVEEVRTYFSKNEI